MTVRREFQGNCQNTTSLYLRAVPAFGTCLVIEFKFFGKQTRKEIQRTEESIGRQTRALDDKQEHWTTSKQWQTGRQIDTSLPVQFLLFVVRFDRAHYRPTTYLHCPYSGFFTSSTGQV